MERRMPTTMRSIVGGMEAGLLSGAAVIRRQMPPSCMAMLRALATCRFGGWVRAGSLYVIGCEVLLGRLDA